MASFEITRSKPGRAGITAASSARSRARKSPRVSGLSRSIQANSSSRAVIAGDRIEHAVHEARFGAIEERLCQLEVFVDDNLARDLPPAGEFECRTAQDG